MSCMHLSLKISIWIILGDISESFSEMLKIVLKLCFYNSLFKLISFKIMDISISFEIKKYTCILLLNLIKTTDI
jgi:hypothetical protein